MVSLANPISLQIIIKHNMHLRRFHFPFDVAEIKLSSAAIFDPQTRRKKRELKVVSDSLNA